MQAIQTKYHGPTNTRGARITARADAGRISVPYEYGRNPHRAAAEALCAKLNWSGADTLIEGVLADNSHVFVFPER